MRELLDLDRHPIDRLDTPQGEDLVRRCRTLLQEQGMFDLEGFVRPAAIRRAVSEIWPRIESEGYRHARRHNIYFKNHIAGLPDDHPALTQFSTAHRTLCADQLPGSVVETIYEWPPMLSFLARVIDVPRLYVMDDALARFNVISYGHGDGLNWHFDRSQYTTTLLIRTPEAGGEFQYRGGLRSEADPNYEGVARLVQDRDSSVATHAMTGGTLNVFAGRNTAHRVTPVAGEISRLIAVFSYYDKPGVAFSREELMGFYGRETATYSAPRRATQYVAPSAP